MGWMNEDAPEHEGWIVMVLRDGREGGSVSGAGIGVSYRMPDSDDVLPDSELVRWAAGCECGWRAPLRDVTDADRVGPSFPWLSEQEEDETFLPLWHKHLAPFVGLDQVAAAQAAVLEAQGQLTDAVRTARASGASWSEVARVVGMTKQGAQQRWGSAGDMNSEEFRLARNALIDGV